MSPTAPVPQVGTSVFRLWGFMGAPGVSRSTREDQHVFVNRRPVENRGLNFALLEGYHTALMKGRYPVCCLFLEIDPAAVDVNIHPAKREVKFHRESEVRRLVAQAVRETLLKFHSRRGRSRESRVEGRGPSGSREPKVEGREPLVPPSSQRTGIAPQSATAGHAAVAGRPCARSAQLPARAASAEHGLSAPTAAPGTRRACPALEPRPSTFDRRSSALDLRPSSLAPSFLPARARSTAQRSASPGRRDRQALRRAGIGSRPGVARPTRGSRADSVRADADAPRAESAGAIAKTAAARNRGAVGARCGIPPRTTCGA